MIFGSLNKEKESSQHVNKILIQYVSFKYRVNFLNIQQLPPRMNAFLLLHNIKEGKPMMDQVMK